MQEQSDFIKINRIIKNEETKKVSVKPDNIRIKDVRSFRPWFKMEDDDSIDGDITLVKVMEDGKKISQVKIAESVHSFSERIGGVIELP